jgi:hypothetical protein
VQASNQVQFAQGQPWDYTPGEPIEGGHAVVVGGYFSATPASDVRFITWGRETSFTDNFWNHSIEECWVVIWPEIFGTKAFQEGVDLAAAESAYQALTGRVMPVPGGSPVPAPTPAGCVVAALPVLALVGALAFR